MVPRLLVICEACPDQRVRSPSTRRIDNGDGSIPVFGQGWSFRTTKSSRHQKMLLRGRVTTSRVDAM